MKIPNTLKVIIVLLLSTLVACVLFPFIWKIWGNWLAFDDPPGRVFRRVWQIAILLGLILARKQIGMQHPAYVGLNLTKAGFKNCLYGFGVVWLFLFALSTIYILIGAWEPVSSFQVGKLFEDFFEGLLRGCLVAGVEEYIFRGLIFLSLASRWGWIKAAVFSSVIFSSLHFIEGRGDEMQSPDLWYSGFSYCGSLMAEMLSRFELFPKAVGLFIVGFIFCYCVQLTGTLWYSAGLHAGWVCFFSFRGALFEPTGNFTEFWIGGGRIYNGIIPMITILIIFPLTRWLIHKRIVQNQ